MEWNTKPIFLQWHQESQYDEEIRELMEIFVPVENVSKEEQELAKTKYEKICRL